jgi:hypothetical protein
MRKFLFAIAAFVLIVISSSSCKKDTVTNTVTVRDTTVITDTVASTPLSVAQILASHTWEVEGESYDNAGTITQYIRDSVNTTGLDQDTLRLTFTTTGGGTYRDETGSMHTLTWSFTPPSYMFIQLAGGPNYSWSAVNITDSSFDETTSNPPSLISGKWIAVK